MENNTIFVDYATYNEVSIFYIFKSRDTFIDMFYPLTDKLMGCKFFINKESLNFNDGPVNYL